eukprot:3406351-Rhodomonas_salina.1
MAPLSRTKVGKPMNLGRGRDVRLRRARTAGARSGDHVRSTSADQEDESEESESASARSSARQLEDSSQTHPRRLRTTMTGLAEGKISVEGVPPGPVIWRDRGHHTYCR